MFEIRIDEDAHEFLLSLHPKSQKIIKENLRKLETNLFPGDSGDKEKLDLPLESPSTVCISAVRTRYFRVSISNVKSFISIFSRQ